MFKIYIPKNKGKIKTSARGFWLDGKKIYYDYIDFKLSSDLSYIEYLRLEYKQIAIFYEDLTESKAFIKSEKEADILTQKKIFRISGNFYGLKKSIKSFLKIYKGLTIYKKIGYYIIETWSA